MDVKELTFRGEDKARALCCGKCGTVYSPSLEDLAVQCCDRRCRDCGTPLAENRMYCAACQRLRAEKEERGLFDAATKVSADVHVGPVYDPRNDHYYEDLDAFESDCDLEKPAYLWACTSFRLKISIDSVVENALESMHEDAEVDDYEGLKAFVDAWNAKQTCVSWEPDYDKAVVFP